MKLLSVASFLYAASQALAANNVSSVIFQGFDYSWERKIMGFETPHRLGSVAAFVDNSNFICQFTPGVDGDFAHPRLLYAVLDKEAPMSSLSGHWHSILHDRAEHTDHPFAEINIQDQIVINTPASFAGELGRGFDAAVVLNGFNVSMQCNSSCGICNSNGAWVYSFNMSISNCTNDGNSIECEISFGLGRGWTPTHGGGKSFNLCMIFDVTIYFTAIEYERSTATALISSSFEKQGLLSEGVATTPHSFEAPSGAKPVFNGISAFGWELLETEGIADRGRYLESYHFSVTQPEMSWESNFTFNVSMGLSDPSLTTVPSRARYHISALTLMAPFNDSHLNTLEAVATVCKDDPGTEFYCSKHGMNDSLVDAVPLQL